MIDPIEILREKLATFIRIPAEWSRAESSDAAWNLAIACERHLPAILALPYHLPASALIAIEGFAASDQLPIAAAYPTEHGEWRAVRRVIRGDETATIPDYHAAVAKLREWGCTRIKRRFEDELPETAEGAKDA